MEEHAHGSASGHKCLTTRVMDALFFSDAVYEPTLDAVVHNLSSKLGRISPITSFGFQEGNDQQKVLIARRGSHVLVACRGSCCAKDFFQDLKYFPVRIPFADGAAHWGFFERAQSIPIETICELLNAREDIIFTGHSLGGAVASLLCLRVLQHTAGCYQNQMQCITFGSPLFANWRLAEFINNKYKDCFLHVISQKDVVPRVIPFFSVVQKLVYAGENHLTGLWILRKALECFHWIPIGAFFKTLERSMPSLVKFVLRCTAKLLVSTELNGSYAFAGQIWMLDEFSDTDCKLVLACADDLNVWHSQLNFGFGVRLTPSVFDNHAMSSYYKGILLALAQTLHLKQQSSACSSCDLKLLDMKTGTTITRSWSLSMTASVTDANLSCSGNENDEMRRHHSNIISGIEDSINNIHVDVSTNKKVDPGLFASKCYPIKEHMGCCAGVVRLFLPFSWEKLCAGAYRKEMRMALKRTNRPVLSGYTRSHSLCRLNSWSDVPVKSFINSDRKRSLESSRDASLVTCRMRSAVSRSIVRPPTPKKHFRIRWLIGSLGRVVRHLQALDNLCILTIVSIFFSNLHG